MSAAVGGRKAPEERRREEIVRAAFTVAANGGLASVTARAVAAEARVSPGLVFFYYATIDQLLLALLDWLLARTVVAGEVPAVVAGSPDPAARMMAVVRRDIERLPRQRARVELFFEYWVLGTRDPAIRREIRQALDRYRASFLPVAAELVASEPGRFRGATAEGLASVAASFVEGCALQIVMDPAQFDVERSMATLTALVRQPAGVGV